MRAFEIIVVLLAVAAGVLYGELVHVEHGRLFAMACAGGAFLAGVVVAFYSCIYLFGVNVEPDE